MENVVLYFFFTNVLIIVVFGIRSAYLGIKLMRYIQNNHPEKAAAFGCLKNGWYNGFRFSRALYKEHNIEDFQFIQLKNKAKNAQTITILAMFVFPLFLTLILILRHLIG